MTVWKIIFCSVRKRGRRLLKGSVHGTGSCRDGGWKTDRGWKWRSASLRRSGKASRTCKDTLPQKPVLILDDPFSALDKNTEKQIFANLKQQTKDNIVFLISHRLYLFPQMNQVIWMEDGKAVAGTHEEILEKIPEYRSLYETQSDERENAKVETENRKTVSEHTEERRSGR